MCVSVVVCACVMCQSMVTGILENSHTTVESSDVMVGVEDMFALRQVASAVEGSEGTELMLEPGGFAQTRRTPAPWGESVSTRAFSAAAQHVGGHHEGAEGGAGQHGLQPRARL